jgi:hypothetical protein
MRPALKELVWYVAAGAGYVTLGVFFPSLLYYWLLGAAWLFLVVWIVPRLVRRLVRRLRRRAS